MTRVRSLLVVAGVSMLAACGGQEAQTTPSTDAASDASIDSGPAETDATIDSTREISVDSSPDVTDAGIDTLDTADACDPSSTTPRELLSGANHWIVGSVDAGVVVQTDVFGTPVSTPRPALLVPLDCSPPETIIPAAGPVAIDIRGDVVFAWGQNASAPTPLTVWSKSGGTHDVATASIGQSAISPGFAYADASADGKSIAFFDNVVVHPADSGSYRTGDVVVSNVDGTNRHVAISDLELTCAPELRFAGSRLLVVYCAPDIAGVARGPIVSVDPTTGASTTIAADTFLNISTDASGTTVAFGGTDGASYFAPVTGASPPTKIADGSGYGRLIGDPAEGFGWLTSDDKTWMYTPLSTLSSIVVFSSTAIDGIDFSPDRSWMTFSTSSAASDRWIASTRTPGPPTPIHDSEAWPEGFTRDSSHALYLSSFVPTGVSVGDLHAVTMDGTSTFIASKVAAVHPGAATRIVFLSNPTNDGSGSSYPWVFDAFAVDVARTDPPTLLAPQIDSQALLDRDGTTLVYSAHVPAPSTGVYAIHLP